MSDDDLCDECGRCKARQSGLCWYCVESVDKTDMIDVFEGVEARVSPDGDSP